MKRLHYVAIALISLTLAGCGANNEIKSNNSSAASEPSAEGEKFLLPAEPKDGKDVIEARAASKDGEDVVVIGRIGGEVDPWLKGLAGFRIVDSSLKACSDIPGDSCETPWDYCCETGKLATGAALVKFVDAEGNVVKGEAKSLLGVKELQTVVVAGKAKRDEAGNLTVLAKGIYVRP